MLFVARKKESSGTVNQRKSRIPRRTFFPIKIENIIVMYACMLSLFSHV